MCCDATSNQYPDRGGDCAACADIILGCGTCVVNDGVTECTACITAGGFELSEAICCDLNNNKFPDGSGGCNACATVIPGCVTCGVIRGNTQCQTCDIARGFAYASAVLCCDLTHNQFPDGSGACNSCGGLFPGCFACVVNDVFTECASCNTEAGFELSGTICCDLNNNKFPDGSGGCAACADIILGCGTCEVINGLTECASCNTEAGFQISGTICCYTNSGQYPDGSGACDSCGNIIFGCESCGVIRGHTQCQICDTSQGFVYTSGVLCCDIDRGQYPTATGNCATCDSVITGCQICQVNNVNTICVACDVTAGFELSGTICCDLNNNKFPDGSGDCNACATVIPGCVTCGVIRGNTQCQTCDTSQGFVISGTICCAVGAQQFPSGANNCDACANVIEGCQTCVYNDGNTECTACDTAGGFVLHGTICCIPDGSGVCAQCAEGCLSCTESACTECDTGSGYHLSGSLCCDSNVGDFPAPSGCEACASVVGNCATCTVHQDSGVTECVACAAPFELSGPTMCCDVTSNQYPDRGGDCAACADIILGCGTCEVNDGVTCCIQCNQAGGYILSGSTCCSIGAQEFPDGYDGCEPCRVANIGCLTCQYNFEILLVDCIICDTGYQLSLSVCCDTFIGGPDGNGGCMGCPTGCLTCTHNGESLECGRCDEGYVLSGTECCSIGNEYPHNGACASCTEIHPGCFFCRADLQTSAAQCTACEVDSGYFQSGHTCCNSNNMQYPDGNGGCQACGEVLVGCLECQYMQWAGATSCINCNEEGGFLISETTCCDTNNEMYPDSEGGCQVCSFITGCIACNYDSATIEIACIDCDSNSGYTISGTTCCNYYDGQYPDGDEGCSSCSSLISGCSTCAYKEGFSLMCEQCKSAQDYFSNGDGGCQVCSSFILGCPSCVQEGGNVNCDQCSSIIDNCQKCSDSSTCLSCATGFYLDDGSCIQCPKAYALVNGKCQLCGHHEVKVTTGDACVPCSNIHPSCQTCSDQNTCTFCGFGYQAKADGSGCLHCVDIDAECVACSSDLICTQCLLDYILIEGACEPISEGTTGLFYHDGQKRDCQVGCGSCSGPTSCHSCVSGYSELLSNCFVCDDTCATCQASFICLSCYKGNYLNGTSCVPCSENCLTCTASECQICSDGFGPDGANCNECGDFCAKCISPTECTKCDIGYTSDNGMCISCMIGCRTCEPEQIDICTECGDGYYLKDGVCKLCGGNCYLCDDEDSCRVCETGYNLIADTFCAEACQYPCDQCEGSPTHCSTCFAGYTHDGLGSCIMDTACNSTSNCYICPRTYYLSSQNTCESCPSNCDFCTDGNACTKCSPGFLLSSDSCIACPTGCETCTSKQYCSSCNAGYFEELDDGSIQTGRCLPCSTARHCKECRGTASQCTVCEDGYEFLGIICVLKRRIAYELKIDMKINDFRGVTHSFMIAFMEAINNPEYANPAFLHILSLISGSTIIKAQLEVLQTSASDIYTKILSMKDVNAIHKLFPMIALENVTTIGWTYIEDEEDEEDADPISLGLPWYVIAILVFVVILIIVIVIKFVFFSKDNSNPSGAILSSEPMTSSHPFPSKQNL